MQLFQTHDVKNLWFINHTFVSKPELNEEKKQLWSRSTAFSSIQTNTTGENKYQQWKTGENKFFSFVCSKKQRI